jgi:hypothetical protein
MPETGKAAIQQRCDELRGCAVVVYFALQPGYEDATLLTYLRLAEGALGGVVYMTNGECTPGDMGGFTPLEVAADRKEEAYQATQQLGLDARFLNFADPGVVSSQEELEKVWRRDSLIVRMKEVLRYYRPDVVVVGGDLRGDTLHSMRQRYVLDVLRHVVDIVSRGTGPEGVLATQSPGFSPRIFVEAIGRETKSDYDQKHVALGRTFREIARDVAQAYATLRLQLRHWMMEGDRRYTLLAEESQKQPETMTSGLPAVSARVKNVRTFLRGLVFDKRGKPRTPALPEVVRAIDTLDVFLGRNRGGALGDEVRVLARWKNAIEGLRCALLNVRVDFTVSDSLITHDQLLHLNIRSLTPVSSSLSTRIFFPQAMDHSWGVNQSLDYQFDLKPPQEIPVITPHELRLTLPGAQNGISEQTLRTKFSFNIIHRNKDRMKDFVYRGEVRFRIGPRRSFEVLTPAVRGVHGAQVICRLQNFSRDPYQGTLSLKDSTSTFARIPIRLGPKDSVVVDTLRLALDRSLPEGNHILEAALSGGDKLPVVVRTFEAAIDSQARVGVLTSQTSSPITRSLDRLGCRWESALGPNGGLDDLSKWNVLLFDRDVLAAFPGLLAERERLAKWIQRGGKVIVLPQMAIGDGGLSFGVGARFQKAPLLPPMDVVQIDTTARFLQYPNVLGTEEWDQWVVSRAMGSIGVDPGVDARVLVASRGTGAPLAVSLPIGSGEITLVALDLVSQCLNVHPGVHRILANLLTVR